MVMWKNRVQMKMNLNKVKGCPKVGWTYWKKIDISLSWKEKEKISFSPFQVEFQKYLCNFYYKESHDLITKSHNKQ